VNLRKRLTDTRALFKDLRCDSLLLNHPAHIAYLAGFDAPDSLLIVTRRTAALITDFRYTADFKRRAAAPLKIIEYKNGLFEAAGRQLRLADARRTGFESRYLVFAAHEILNRLCGEPMKLVPLRETIEHLREIKTPPEITLIKKGLDITLKALCFAGSKIKPGTTEREVAAEIERFIRRAGARSSAFDIIVASGPNSSYPHACVTDRKIQAGEPIIIDMGVDIDGYKCDLTRTFFLGKMPPIVRRIVDIVSLAQKKAIQAIKPGVPLKVVDAAARRFITQKGYGKQFGHALGHGVGLEVHEAPFISKRNDRPAEPGMVFTVEPGIYLPGKFGIRMEEMVLVTREGVEVISGSD